MVYLGKNSFIVFCDCGCENAMKVTTFGDMVCISFLSSNFYSKQFSLKELITEKYKELSNLITKHKFVNMDILVNNSDKEDFIKALQSIKVKENIARFENDSYIRLDKSDLEDADMFAIELVSKMKVSKALSGKSFQTYDICMNKTQWNYFVNKCIAYLNK